MSKVAVKWLKSPRHKYRIPRAPGSASLVDVKLAKQILEEDPDFLIPLEPLEKKKERPVEVKDTQVKKARTRPVTREKGS